ncbi:hypothetical protein [Planctomicrobium sp. SH664]|uniref:hypothetical protein n=1 Tax=Planctomicrobium sp. SH664 TaxID=3448125 RepID=UPI003F5BB9C5
MSARNKLTLAMLLVVATTLVGSLVAALREFRTITAQKESRNTLVLFKLAKDALAAAECPEDYWNDTGTTSWRYGFACALFDSENRFRTEYPEAVQPVDVLFPYPCQRPVFYGRQGLRVAAIRHVDDVQTAADLPPARPSIFYYGKMPAVDWTTCCDLYYDNQKVWFGQPDQVLEPVDGLGEFLVLTPDGTIDSIGERQPARRLIELFERSRQVDARRATPIRNLGS